MRKVYVRRGDSYVLADPAEEGDIIVITNDAKGPPEIKLGTTLIVTVEDIKVAEELRDVLHAEEVIDWGDVVTLVVKATPDAVKALFTTQGVKRVDISGEVRLL
ncbi:hypothetical protein [Pyrobaculum sp.]|uniref:hypothetical protein n=1 Tax=Pyrobaculum sp. TaxID=2004705 RepID=UPI003D12261F